MTDAILALLQWIASWFVIGLLLAAAAAVIGGAVLLVAAWADGAFRR